MNIQEINKPSVVIDGNFLQSSRKTHIQDQLKQINKKNKKRIENKEEVNDQGHIDTTVSNSFLNAKININQPISSNPDVSHGQTTKNKQGHRLS